MNDVMEAEGSDGLEYTTHTVRETVPLFHMFSLIDASEGL
jgi:hypothetical protein